MSKKFYDTNGLLQLLEKAFDEEFIISSKTLEEIEHIKVSDRKDQEIKYRSRKLIRLLDENQDRFHVVVPNSDIFQILASFELEENPDNIIVACAFYYNSFENITFVSNDICCKVIAKNIFGLNVESTYDEDEIYRGYKIIRGNTTFINGELSEENYNNWSINEYAIIENTDDNSVKEMRFDGEKFISLKLPPSKYVKGKNSLQRCALDALMNPNITITAILGGYGSGKTFLSMQMALYNIQEKGSQSKILGVREPRGEGKEVGFLPGTLQDKTDNFFLPLAQQLNGGEFELESLKHSGILESNIPYYLKGTTYNDTIIMCDEAEDLTQSQIKLIGTRLGQNSKIYFSGDYKQSLLSKTSDNALVKMCNEFKGNPKFACVYLGEDVRSETSKLFAELFKND